MQEEPDLIACDCCDAVFRRTLLARGQIARCGRCGAELDRHAGEMRRALLPLSLASLILLMLANAFPIVTMELQGQSSHTTLLGAVMVLALDGKPFVAVLVLATTVLFPFLYLSVLTLLSLPWASPVMRNDLAWLVRMVRASRPWGMIEVFMLGILVALVKLASMATIEPGIALWSFVAATVLLTAILGFDLRGFWLEDREGRPEPLDQVAALR